ncbi:hypothetical protein L210DRAFT_3541425 [Boletus edulis BED1]|uniref:Secreted protein n=1 Tax=Boletus edulis BED1 TaxID=1328754 RepID=A0AAD4BTW5_BOLED|nr:hypothetical protein L210DRAFT_3541425 [Boletus edulis BED1]
MKRLDNQVVSGKYLLLVVLLLEVRKLRPVSVQLVGPKSTVTGNNKHSLLSWPGDAPMTRTDHPAKHVWIPSGDHPRKMSVHHSGWTPSTLGCSPDHPHSG